jgi:hypothetical protein
MCKFETIYQRLTNRACREFADAQLGGSLKYEFNAAGFAYLNALFVVAIAMAPDIVPEIEAMAWNGGNN